MVTKIKLPNGSLTSNETITTVDLTPKGVVCRDARRNVVAWIPVTDPVKSEQVLKLMTDFVLAGRWGVQPCWDFLKDSAVAAS